MFLTRIGFGSKVVITGDSSQKDLSAGTKSGLDIATRVLSGVDEIAFCNLTSKDVVRHPLVQKIVKAYDDYEEKPKRSLFHKNTKDNDKDFDEDDEDDYTAPVKSKSAFSNNKVTPMRQPSRRSSVNMEVCVIKPTSVEDSREITETLLNGRTVIINMEGLSVDLAQRDWILRLLSVLLILLQELHLQSVVTCRKFLITYSW